MQHSFLLSPSVHVSEAIRPLPVSLRQPARPIVGDQYYYSFGNHIARPCMALAVYDVTGRVKIAVYDKESDSILSLLLYWDEIGATPEEAVINEVSY
jgi:hypothetical protein